MACLIIALSIFSGSADLGMYQEIPGIIAFSIDLADCWE